MHRMHNGHKKQPNSIRDLFFLIIYAKIEWPLKKGHFDLLCKPRGGGSAVPILALPADRIG